MRFNVGRLKDEHAVLNTRTANSLFQTEAMKWSSMIEAPGMWLDNVKQPQLASELRAELKAFQFQPFENSNKYGAVILRLVAAAAAGIICGFLIPFKLAAILIGVAVFLAAFLLLGKIIDSNKNNEFDEYKDRLMRELSVEKKRLEAICKRYER